MRSKGIVVELADQDSGLTEKVSMMECANPLLAATTHHNGFVPSGKAGVLVQFHHTHCDECVCLEHIRRKADGDFSVLANANAPRRVMILNGPGAVVCQGRELLDGALAV